MTIPESPVPVVDRESSTVLAVDDEPSVLSALVRLLRPHDMRVLTATTGPEALQLLGDQASLVGVVISDYAMPGMNGAELLHAVRLRWPDITRVLLTGNADLPAAARAVNEGQLSRLYTKPWNPDELRRAVAEALEQHRLLLENRGLRVLAGEQAVRLEQWNQRLEGLVTERTAELEQANVRLHRGLLETVRLLLTSVEHRLPERAARCKEVARSLQSNTNGNQAPEWRPPGVGDPDQAHPFRVTVETLRAGMVLVDEVRTKSGAVLLRPGDRLTAAHVQRIQQFHQDGVLFTSVFAIALDPLVADSVPPLIDGDVPDDGHLS